MILYLPIYFIMGGAKKRLSESTGTLSKNPITNHINKEQICLVFAGGNILNDDTILPNEAEIKGTILQKHEVCGGIKLIISQDAEGKNLYFTSSTSDKKLLTGYDDIQVRNSNESDDHCYSYIQLSKNGKKLRSIAFFDQDNNDIDYISSPKNNLLIEHSGLSIGHPSYVSGMENLGDGFYFIRKINGEFMLLGKNGVIEASKQIVGDLLNKGIRKNPKFFGQNNKGIFSIVHDENTQKDILIKLKMILLEGKNEQKLIENILFVYEGSFISYQMFDRLFSEEFLLSEEVLNSLHSNISDYVMLFAYLGKYIKNKTVLSGKARSITDTIKIKTGFDLFFTSNIDVSYKTIEQEIKEITINDRSIIVIPLKGKIGTIEYAGSDTNIAKEFEGKKCIIEFSGPHSISSIRSIDDPNQMIESKGYVSSKVNKIKREINTFLSEKMTKERRGLLKRVLNYQLTNTNEIKNDYDIIVLYTKIIKIQFLEEFLKEFPTTNLPKSLEKLDRNHNKLMIKYYNLYINYLESLNLLFESKKINSIHDYKSFSIYCLVSLNRNKNYQKDDADQKKRIYEILNTLPGDIKYKIGNDNLPYFTRGKKSLNNPLDLFSLNLEMCEIGTDQILLDNKIEQVLYIGCIYDVLSEAKNKSGLGYSDIRKKIGRFPNYAPVFPVNSQYNTRIKFASLYQKPDRKILSSMFSFNEIKEMLIDYIILPKNERKNKHNNIINKDIELDMELAVFLGDISSFSKKILE